MTEIKMTKKAVKLVADSIAFLKNSPLQEYAEEVYSIPMVIGEIKDLATKERLQVLPYELKLKEPSTEAIKFVTEFSKKTGDFAVLSAVDIQVIALTYQLAVEAGLGSELKQEPKIIKTIQIGSDVGKSSASAANLPGFVTNIKDDIVKPKGVSLDDNSEPNNEPVQIITESFEQVNLSPSQKSYDKNSDAFRETDKLEDSDQLCSDGESPQNSDGDGDDEDDDDEGWITPCNVRAAKIAMRNREFSESKSNAELQVKLPEVACLTADFAMQNVLKQIGLAIVSIDGRIIENVRTHILRCYGCFKTTPDMDKIFCPGCGHKTLKRVAATLNEDGSLKIYLSRRKTLTGRGKRFPLPLPKGGKYAKNPILFEDQKEAQKRASKLARQKNNPLDDDYIAGNSPFVIRDVYSKAAILGRQGKEKIEYWERKNPNEVVHRSGRRKRK
ncbi:RNA-binding protein NOB1-like [Artemia franciscana]|uniref:RNA-binding protein NOB1 n=1 Tax=Artemia franciscana TaxID=6661 RepID=A0AA88L8E3_ARTSF|nr:hypothetical protein QYM36_002715 [Artemia franciscana]